MNERVSIKKETLQGIGNAIRAKTGKETPIPVLNLASEIEGIVGDASIPTYDGECTGGIAVASEEPMAYSYNGAVLPALPEWDREAYPFATIGGIEDLTVAFPGVVGRWYSFYLASVPGYWEGATVVYKVPLSTQAWFFTTSQDMVDLFKDLGNDHAVVGQWFFAGEEQHDDADYVSTDLPSLWANYDIHDTNGSVYLAASEPVPMYE